MAERAARSPLIPALLLVLSAASAPCAPPRCLKDGTCTPVTFRQPESCGRKWLWKRQERYRACTHRELKEVLVEDGTGRVVRARDIGVVRVLERGGERVWRGFLKQWVACGKAPAALARKYPDRFEFITDPDGRRCAIFRPAERPLSADIARRSNARSLDALHPYLARAARELLRRAWSEGIRVRIISVIRYHKHKKSWQTRRYRSYSHWHAWGLAFDLNLVGVKSLSAAKKRFGRDRRQWERLGRIALDLGIIWAGDHKSHDIFHFEWHPGYGGLIKRAELVRFLELAGPDGRDFRKVWRLFPHPAVTDRGR